MLIQLSYRLIRELRLSLLGTQKSRPLEIIENPPPMHRATSPSWMRGEVSPFDERDCVHSTMDRSTDCKSKRRASVRSRRQNATAVRARLPPSESLSNS